MEETTDLRVAGPQLTRESVPLRKLEGLAGSDDDGALDKFARRIVNDGGIHCDGCGGRTRKVDMTMVYAGIVVVAFEDCVHIREYVVPGSEVRNNVHFVRVPGGFRAVYGEKPKEKLPPYMTRG
ncbi:MAG: hypothetical protein NUV97_00245 [archaeon]|nr:hypothetical protein [archaeon]MCR4323607.1 hypothetical protein [Nanoarchaeota archaeon]